MSFPQASPHKRQADRFDLLLAEKGLTPDKARKCGDLPKVPLPPGTKIVRIPVELSEDPFKGKPPSNAEAEYQTLHQNFYDKIKRILATDEPKTSNTSHNAYGETRMPVTDSKAGAQTKPRTDGDQVLIQMSGPQREVQLQVTKTGVQATLAVPKDKKK